MTTVYAYEGIAMAWSDLGKPFLVRVVAWLTRLEDPKSRSGTFATLLAT